MFLRSSSVPKSVQSRCKVGGKSVREGRNIEFGSELQGRKGEEKAVLKRIRSEPETNLLFMRVRYKEEFSGNMIELIL